MGSLYAIMTPWECRAWSAGSDAELAIDACTVILDRRSVRSSRSFSYCETRESKVVWSRVGGEELDLGGPADLGVVGIELRERHRDAGGRPQRRCSRQQSRHQALLKLRSRNYIEYE